MKGPVLIVVALVLAVGAGFGGGFAAATLHDSSVNVATGQVPTITNFKLMRPVIENGSGFQGADYFVLNATEHGVPYKAAFQVVLMGFRGNLTLASGSFFGSLNFEPLSVSNELIYTDLPPGNYSLVATVMHGDSRASMDTSLQVIPELSAAIYGSHDVNDSSGPASVTYSASVSGGRGPYSYNWSITYVYGPNPQNYAAGPEHGSSFSVTFSINSSNAYYGTNQTFLIGLTVTDSLGYMFSYTAGSVYGNEGYIVNVTGN